MKFLSAATWSVGSALREPHGPIALPIPGFLATWPPRELRVLIVLSVVWVLNLFDLSYTLLEADGKHFRELNPVAAYLLDHPHALVLYKFSLVTIGSVILLTHRRLRIVEVSSLFVLAAYVYVAVRWTVYFADLHICFNDPAIHHESLLGIAAP